ATQAVERGPFSRPRRAPSIGMRRRPWRAAGECPVPAGGRGGARAVWPSWPLVAASRVPPGSDGEEEPAELAVIAFLQGVEQVGGGVDLAVVLDLLVALDLQHAAVLELEAVGGVGQVGFLHQHALEGGRVEAEGGAALQPLLVGVAVDVLEVLV